MLDCPRCHALIHGTELTVIAAEARALETKSRFAEAREAWGRSLALLPPDSNQAQWVRDHLQSLAVEQAKPPAAARPQNAWVKRLGPFAPIALLLAKFKGLLFAVFKLKSLLSFFSFLAIYVAMFGWRFGVGITLSILIHEMGHFIDIKRRGLPAEMPVFLPGLGAYVKWTSMGVTKRQSAQIALAGPLAGLAAAAFCLGVFLYTHDPLWAALARTGAMINVFNLIPVWMLDGGKAASSLGLVERAALLASALGLGLYFWEPTCFLVAAGAAFRLFTRDKPQREDWSTLLYYVGLLAALAFVLHSSPLIYTRNR
jgi:Zn-dependent protease